MMISASILSCNFAKLGSEIVNLSLSGIESIHFDIMDGTFVPNISFGFPILDTVRQYTALEIDVHLMVHNPISQIKLCAKYGANSVIFHPETVHNVNETIQLIKKYNMKVGLAISSRQYFNQFIPYLHEIDTLLIMSVDAGFGGQVFQNFALSNLKTSSMYKKLHELDNLRIGVDGGINEETAPLCWKNGADFLVSGSYLFQQPNLNEAVSSLKNKKRLP